MAKKTAKIHRFPIKAKPRPEAEDTSVVSAKYRKKYAKAGHAGNCGDWLAQTLEKETHDVLPGQPGFDIEAYLTLLDMNGVDSSKYMKNQTQGWIGRLRMTTRALLARKIIGQGFIILRGKKVKVPAEWVKEQTDKPKLKVKPPRSARAKADDEAPTRLRRTA